MRAYRESTSPATEVLSWHETELGKGEGNIQFPTMADARMAYKAPIEPKLSMRSSIISSASGGAN
jgi:hypothetical protein